MKSKERSPIMEEKNTEITHEILERLAVLEEKMKTLQSGSEEMLRAFNAAKGAFDFLEGLARVVKPLLFIGGLVGAFIFWVKGVKI